MKNITDFLGLGITAKVFKPKYKEITITGNIQDKTGVIVEVERDVTLCQITVVVDIPYGDLYSSHIGVSIRNPEDRDDELGRTIAYGRAIKNPINAVIITSERKLPKPIIEEQLIWAEKHVERNLDGFVNDLRVTLRK